MVGIYSKHSYSGNNYRNKYFTYVYVAAKPVRDNYFFLALLQRILHVNGQRRHNVETDRER